MNEAAKKIAYISAIISAVAAALALLAEKWPAKPDVSGNTGAMEK